MTAKILKSSSYGKAQDYVLDEKNGGEKSEWVTGRNVVSDRLENARNEVMIDNKINGKAQHKYEAVHIILSQSPRDRELSREEWEDIADRTMIKMGVDKHTTVISKHNDTENPHIHIVANYYDKDGKQYQDSKDFKRINEEMRAVEKDYGLEANPTVRWGDREEARTKKTQFEIHLEKNSEGFKSIPEKLEDIRPKLKKADTWHEMDRELSKAGLHIERKGNGSVVTDGYYARKMSAVDREFSRGKLEEKFGQKLNEYLYQRKSGISQKDQKALKEAFMKSAVMNDRASKIEARTKGYEIKRKELHNLNTAQIGIKSYDKGLRRMVGRYIKGDTDKNVKTLRAHFNKSGVEATFDKVRNLPAKNFTDEFNSKSPGVRERIVKEMQATELTRQQILKGLPDKFSRKTSQERDKYLEDLRADIENQRQVVGEGADYRKSYQVSMNLAQKLKKELEEPSKEQRDAEQIYVKSAQHWKAVGRAYKQWDAVAKVMLNRRALINERDDKKEDLQVLKKYEQAKEQFDSKTTALERERIKIEVREKLHGLSKEEAKRFHQIKTEQVIANRQFKMARKDLEDGIKYRMLNRSYGLDPEAGETFKKYNQLAYKIKASGLVGNVNEVDQYLDKNPNPSLDEVDRFVREKNPNIQHIPYHQPRFDQFKEAVTEYAGVREEMKERDLDPEKLQKKLSTFDQIEKNETRERIKSDLKESIKDLQVRISEHSKTAKSLKFSEINAQMKNGIQQAIAKTSPEGQAMVKGYQNVKRTVAVAKAVGHVASEPVSGSIRLAKEGFKMAKKALNNGDKGVERDDGEMGL